MRRWWMPRYRTITHAGKLGYQGEDHLRGRIHVIVSPDEGVGVQVDVAVAENHSYPVGLDGDLLTGSVAHITSAPLRFKCGKAWTMPWPRSPRRSIRRPSRHHGVHALLLHPLAFPPVTIVGAFPIADLGIVDPDDPARMDALGYADGFGRAWSRPDVTAGRQTLSLGIG